MSNALWNKLYPEEEQKRIDDLEEQNNTYEEYFEEKRKSWNEKLDPIFKVIYQDNFSRNNSKLIVDAQADALNYRQKLNGQISFYSQKLAKAKSENSALAQQKFLLYSTNFGLKTNLGEKKLLIEGHLRENDRYCNLIETQIEFLRESLKTLESYGYAFKNIIQLMEYLGK